MDLDRQIGNYLMESYLQQPVCDNPRFQKLMLLKKLELELLKPVSEAALELMERLAEVGVVSDAMRRAYCLVAVDCTLRRVKLRQDAAGRNFEFFDVVKRLWRGRIGRVVKSEAEGGLGSELLLECKDMIETAVWDDSGCDCVLKKFEGVSAVEAVEVYVREEWAKMGASFLELAAEALKTDQGLEKIMGVDVAAGGSGSGNDPMIRVRGPERMHNNMKKRRPVRKWSLWEEVNLWNAVKECGAGNWKLILTAYPDIFLDRTQVDLKDKWRNMTRSS